MAEQKKAQRGTINFGDMNIGKRLKWAAKAIFGFKEASPLSKSVARSEDAGFLRITNRSDKELNPAKWQKQLAVAHFLWLQNPMAARLLELQADFVVGDGFTFSAEDENVRKVLERHWNDPDNDWDMRQYDRFIELSLFGVWSPKVFINEKNGHVKLSPVDPSWIQDVIPSEDVPGKVVKMKIKKDASQATPTDWDVISQDDEKMSPTRGMLKGDVFYFTINRLSFLLLGVSDLFRIADWVDAFDQFVFSLMERINFLSAHLYDITIEDAEQTEIDQRVQDLEANPPKPGSFRVHNQKERWDAVAPKLNSAEVESIARIVKTLILGSFGIPEGWFSDGGETNRSTLEQQGGPIHRKLKRRQGHWKSVLRSILQFQIDQAIIAKTLKKPPEDQPYVFDIQAPNVSSSDIKQYIDSLKSITDSLGLAIAEGFIKRAKAAGVWTNVANELGVEIEAPTEEEVEENMAEEAESTDAAAQASLEDLYRKSGVDNGGEDRAQESFRTLRITASRLAKAVDTIERAQARRRGRLRTNEDAPENGAE